MWGRFLLIVESWDAHGGALPPAVEENIGRLAAPLRWSAPGVRIYAEAGVPLLVLGKDEGVIIGSLFRRDNSAAPVGPEDHGAHFAILQDAGTTLLKEYWGSYIALLRPHRREEWHVVRDPSAAVPLYHAACGNSRALASSSDMFIALHILAPQVDWAYVRHALVYPRMRTARTGLVGCHELLAGMALGPDGTTRLAWSPWAFASRSAQLHDAGEAAALLRGDLLRTISAVVPRDRKMLLELSGGLDSSIVAAALGEAGTAFDCATFATISADGDERRYARLAAERAGSKLDEILETEGCAPTALTARRPRPGPTPVLRIIDDALQRKAEQDKVQLLLSGGGGDNVFCYLTTATPALDALLINGPRAAIDTLRDVAAVTGSSIWTAGRFALHKGISACRGSSWRQNLTFLADPLADTMPELHPWLERPPPCLPGKIEHVRAIVQIFDFLDTSERAATTPMLFPLLAQPIVELCLRTPSWMWIRHGRDRAVARTAMAGLVPEPIVRRSSKGRLEGLFARGFASIRDAIPKLLIGGILDQQGCLDRSAIIHHLEARHPDHDLDYRLLSIVAVELWLRSWMR